MFASFGVTVVLYFIDQCMERGRSSLKTHSMCNYCFVYTINLYDLLFWFNKGTGGVEPPTSRSAVECSTTELYPQIILFILFKFNLFHKIILFETGSTATLRRKTDHRYTRYPWADIIINSMHTISGKMTKQTESQ